MQASASNKATSVIAKVVKNPPCYGDLCVLCAHGGLIVLRVGEYEEGDPQLVDLVQGQRILWTRLLQVVVLQSVVVPARFHSGQCLHLGTDGNTKTDEFSEKFQRGGGGSFSIQKFMLQILDFK